MNNDIVANILSKCLVAISLQVVFKVYLKGRSDKFTKGINHEVIGSVYFLVIRGGPFAFLDPSPCTFTSSLVYTFSSLWFDHGEQE